MLDFEKLYNQLKIENSELKNQLSILIKQNESIANTNSELSSQIALLNASINELSRRTNQNNTNSGKPPSADPYKKPNSKKNNA